MDFQRVAKSLLAHQHSWYSTTRAITAPQASCPSTMISGVHRHRVFEARDDDVAREVAGNAADEDVATRRVHSSLRRH